MALAPSGPVAGTGAKNPYSEDAAMKIAIGSDHAGYEYKERIKQCLLEMGHEVLDFGTDSSEAADYPLFIRPAAEAVARQAEKKS